MLTTTTSRSLIAGTTGALSMPANPLQKWLDALEAQNKSELLLELEMWIKCFDRFFRVRNHPLSEQEARDVVRRDFSEELKIVRSVSLRMLQLCTEILTAERAESLNFGHYVETQLKHDDAVSGSAESLTGQITPQDSLSLLIESLADLRSILDGLAQLPVVSFQTFTSAGKLINREIKRCRYIELLLAHKFKPQYDRIDHQEITAIIKSLKDPSLRQAVAKVFLEVFRLLRYLGFIEADLRDDRPLKRALLIFALINSEARLLLDFIENKLLLSHELKGETNEAIAVTAYAMRMELNKVFGRELVGFVHLRQAPPIYAKVENSHGILCNCLQQVIVNFARAFDPNFEGASIFENFQTRFQQSCRLRAEIWKLICYLRHFEERADRSRIAPLIEALADFRDGSLRFLMYKDWDQYEQFYEEVISSRDNQELARVLHRFVTYLETLLGQVNLRAVLADHPFDYPKVEIAD
jgi:hypothetical protein